MQQLPVRFSYGQDSEGENRVFFQAGESTKPLKDFSIACILDEFSYECFKYEANLVQIEPESWQDTLLKMQPDLLLVESAWKGKDSKWRYKVGGLLTSQDETLKELVCWCQENNIPAVFWNKEDPPNFDYFIDAAKLFDYVFTSDYNCIPQYREILGHDNIFPLAFAAQPRIHNPVNRHRGSLGQVAFAGTWYNQKHKDRSKNLEILLRPAQDYDLDIYDRMYENQNRAYRFPDIFEPSIKGSLPYEQMVDVYKKYNVFLNVNSVADSPTMFSRRVFELLACGTPVISSYSIGIEEMLPGLLKLSRTEQETKQYLQELLGSKDLRDRMALQGQREVFGYHTYRHRMETMFDCIGLNFRKEEIPAVSVISIIKRANDIEQIMENFLRQLYPEKELILILHNNALNLEEYREKLQQYENIKVLQIDECSSKGSCLKYGLEQSVFPYVAIFDENSYYAANFLVDLIHAFYYTDAGLVGKSSYYVESKDNKRLAIRNANMENRYVSHLNASTIVGKREVFDRIGFMDKSRGIALDFLKRCVMNGIRLYSSDRFNYLSKRFGPVYRERWKINGGDYMDIVACDNAVEHISV